MELRTENQRAYFAEVIRLHREYGYGESRISRIIPVGHSTVSRWIAIFRADNRKKSDQVKKQKAKSPPCPSPAVDPQGADEKALQTEIVRLRAQLKAGQLRADAYDEMINVAERKFNISIRKKVGAKR
jgi:hypothetical protein